MSTYLELCKKVAQECGIGDADGTSPETVVGQYGELKRVIDWVNQAWSDLQNRHPNWNWMRASFMLLTEPGVNTYSYEDAIDVDTAEPITRFARWMVDDDDDYAKIYLQSSGIGTQTWLTFTPWNAYKSIFRIGANNLSEGYPGYITIDPRDNLVFGGIPNGVYAIHGEYQRSPQILLSDDDVPEMPPRFHDLIMYLAMEKYALYESAPEVLARARSGRGSLLGRLEANQLPEIRMAGPLA